MCGSVPACGTSFPGFMIGTDPKKIGKIAKKKVCFTEGSNCCAKRVSIKVMRCEGDFLVYQLPAAPSGSYRYCGQKSKQNYTINCKNISKNFVTLKADLHGTYRSHVAQLNSISRCRYNLAIN